MIGMPASPPRQLPAKAPAQRCSGSQRHIACHGSEGAGSVSGSIAGTTGHRFYRLTSQRPYNLRGAHAIISRCERLPSDVACGDTTKRADKERSALPEWELLHSTQCP